MIRVLFFIPTLSTGGAERVLCNLVNKLCEVDGLNISVLTLFKDERCKLSAKIDYSYVFAHKFRGNVQLLKLFPPTWLYNRMISVRGKYDIVVSYLQSPTMRIVGGCKDLSVKLVNWIHNEFHTLSKLTLVYRSRKECIRSLTHYNATVYVANSAREAMKECLPDIAGANSYVIYNVNDFDKILRSSVEKIDDVIFSRKSFNLISVGRFTEQKAFDRLIRLIKFLQKNDLSAELFLLGDGSLKEKYIEEATKLCISDKVHLLGFKANPFKYVRSADLFVCSSLHEGYSTAVTEALVVGTPVVATQCSGMAELLGDNEFGLICANEENDLANTVLDLIQDSNKYEYYKAMAIQRGRELMRQNNVKPVINLFNTLCNGK